MKQVSRSNAHAILAALLGTPLISAAAVAQPSHPAVVIGQLTSRTGNNPAGREGEEGAIQAVAEINAGGGVLGGRTLELRVEDDATNVDAGLLAFDRLSASGVAAVVGSSYSNVSLAVIPKVEAARIPYVSTGAADGQVEPVRPYMFMTSLAGRLVGEQLLQFLHGRAIKRLAVIYDADSRFASSGWARQRTFLDRYGIQLVSETSVRVDTQDFGQAIAAIRSSGAEAVMAWLTGPPAVAFIKAYADAGVALPVVTSHGSASRGFLSQAGKAAEGLYVATSLGVVADQAPHSQIGDMARAMSARFVAAHGHPPSQYAIDGYVAVRLIAAAIERAGSDDPRAIRDALETQAVPTPQGVYRYTQHDHAGLRADDIAIAQIHGGEFLLTEWSRRHFATNDAAPHTSEISK